MGLGSNRARIPAYVCLLAESWVVHSEMLMQASGEEKTNAVENLVHSPGKI